MTSIDRKLEYNASIEESAEKEFQRWEQHYASLANGENYPEHREQLRDIEQHISERTKSEILEISSEDYGRNISGRTSEGFAQVAYGFCRHGGVITFRTVDNADDIDGEVTSGEYLHIYLTTHACPIESFDNLYLDNEKVPFDTAAMRWANSSSKYAGLVFASNTKRGQAGESANGDLVSQSAANFTGQWTNAHLQAGYAGLYTFLKWDPEVFPHGAPEIAVEVKGHNQIFDPRSSAYQYTSNAALCIAEYLTNSDYGLGFDYADIDATSLLDAIATCDEVLTNADSSTETRYQLNGVFQVNSSNSPKRLLEHFKNAIAGDIVFTGAKWKILPGKFRNSVLSLDAKDLRSGISVKTRPSLRTLFNKIKGKARGIWSKWEQTDYPPFSSATYQTQDGQELVQEIDFPFTTSIYALRRLCGIRLKENRETLTFSCDFGLRAYILQPGDIFDMTYERFGWNAKLFKVTEWQHVITSTKEKKIRIVAKEYSQQIYDGADDGNFSTATAANSDLQNQTELPAPTGVVLQSGTSALLERSDGTVFSRICITWDAATNAYILSSGWFEIQVKKSSDSNWENKNTTPGDQNVYYVLDVQDGVFYDVRVRARTTFGVSDWSTSAPHLVVGKEQIPSTPSNFRKSFNTQEMVLEWDGINDLDLKNYEVREGNDWVTATVIDNKIFNNYLAIPALAVGTYTFWLAAKDTSNLYSSAISLVVTINQYASVENVIGTDVGNLTAKITWTAPTQTIFPISGFRIWQGVDTSAANLIGDSGSNFAFFTQPAAGTYKFWIAPIDTAGNLGIETSVDVTLA